MPPFYQSQHQGRRSQENGEREESMLPPGGSGVQGAEQPDGSLRGNGVQDGRHLIKSNPNIMIAHEMKGGTLIDTVTTVALKSWGTGVWAAGRNKPQNFTLR